MPNPLTLMTSAPTTAAKPAAPHRHDGEAEASKDFQSVLDLDSLLEPVGTEAETALPTVEEAEIEPAERDTAPVPGALTETQPAPVESAEKPVVVPQINDQPPEVQVPLEAAMATGQAERPITPNKPRADMSAPTQTQSAAPVITGLTQAKTLQGPQVELGMVSNKPLPVKTLEGPVLEADLKPGGPQITPIQATSPKVAVPVHPATAAQLQLTASLKSAESEGALQVSEGEGLGNARSEPTTQHTRDISPQPNAASAVARAEISRAIAGQMAAAITARPGSGAVEIALNPEELGKVSIVLNGRDDGLHLAITADRPETLDLMRRHIAVLTTEFEKLGFGDMSLDLGTSSGSHQDHPDSRPGQAIETDFAEASGPTHSQGSTPGTGIDMRL